MWNPRVGGEKWPESVSSLVWRGSPPRGRGKAFSVLRRQFRFRITPAWAGKRARCPCWCAGGQDHPRVGGEKRSISAVRAVLVGSPPRRRGKALHLKWWNRISRITPAWAGKRPWMPSDSSSSRDHPRVGGEKLLPSDTLFLELGSPPHGRGKAVCDGNAIRLDGITPA